MYVWIPSPPPPVISETPAIMPPWVSVLNPFHMRRSPSNNRVRLVLSMLKEGDEEVDYSTPGGPKHGPASLPEADWIRGGCRRVGRAARGGAGRAAGAAGAR